MEVSSVMPFEDKTELLSDEWKLLQLEAETPNSRDLPIDQNWNQFINLKDGQEPKYSNISKVVKTAHSISHENAGLNEGFCASLRTLTHCRADMSECTLNALITLKSDSKCWCV